MASAEQHRRLTEPMCIGGSAGLASERESNRRIHTRFKANDVEWLRGASVKYGAAVRVIDISAGGLLLETTEALKPNASVVLELRGPDSPLVIPSKVLRCRVASLGDIVRYEAACAFKRPPTIPELKLIPDTTSPAVSIAQTVESSVGWRKVVARFNDGGVVCGYTNDFHPSKAHLHLSTNLRQGAATAIRLSDLKALFFVREFAGDPTRVEATFFSETSHGRKMEVTFCDNEVMVGSTLSYRTEGHGFVLRPADQRSNNLCVFVTAAGMQQLRFR